MNSMPRKHIQPDALRGIDKAEVNIPWAHVEDET